MHAHGEACASDTSVATPVGDFLVAMYNSVEAHILDGCLPLQNTVQK
jgi:hypothetical protein